MPSALARKLDRLSRTAHAFHRYAHHPLCDEFAREVIRVGPRGRVCRGCTLALSGAVLGACLGLAVDSGPLFAALELPLALVLASLSSRRLGKLATRFLPAGLFVHAAFGGLAPFLAALALAAWSRRRYRWRGPDREPCRTCPERLQEAPCRGFASIVRRERAFLRFSRVLGA